MTVAKLESSEARVDAGGGGRLVDTEAEAGNLDGGVREGEEVSEGEFGGGGGGGHVWFGGWRVVVFFCGGFAFGGGLVFGGEELMVGVEMSEWWC